MIPVYDRKKPDKLEDVFSRQQILMEQYNMQQVDFNTKQGQNAVRACAIHLIEEVCEVLQTLKNKPWVEYEVVVDEKEMKDELADAFHFFVELCIMLGLDARSLHALYVVKNDKNLRRLETKY